MDPEWTGKVSYVTYCKNATFSALLRLNPSLRGIFVLSSYLYRKSAVYSYVYRKSAVSVEPPLLALDGEKVALPAAPQERPPKSLENWLRPHLSSELVAQQ